jgi:ribose transport system ATP-binding protein
MDYITLENVSKRFGGVQALSGVSFGIRHGEVHAIVGENGAGKSTLMKLLAGIHLPDDGRIMLDGRPVRLETAQHAREHGISIVHQELNLFPHLTVSANLFVWSEN